MDMAAEEVGETLVSWLNKATDPNNQGENWEGIQGFCEQVNKEPEGPQTAIRLLAHKIKSPQEKESLQALTVLEACMNSCGKQFHTEAGKFRFLNELIKVLSPKYLGTWSSEKVKEKVTEVLYGWTVWLPDEVKIKEAYQMLKKQGIVKKDPKLSEKILMAPLPPRTQGSVFDDEDKSKLLARLLKSTHPDDLQAANRLIKNTIKEEQEKMEKVSKRITAMEEVENNTKLLKEMLENYRRHRVSDSDRDIMKSLYERCEKLRPTLFRLASDTVDNDDALAEILHANEKLTSVVNLYQELVKSREVNGHGVVEHSDHKAKDPQSPKEIKSYHLIDLSELESLYPNSAAPGGASHDGNSSVSLLDEELMSLGLNDPPLTQNSRTHGVELTKPSSFLGQSPGFSAKVEEGRVGSILTARGCSGDGGQGTRVQGAQGWAQDSNWPVLQPMSLNQPIMSSATHSISEGRPQEKSFSDVFVSLESIKPSSIPPVTAYDQNGFRVMLHFARDSPVGRPDIAVIVISMLSTSPQPVKEIVFQAAVPKTMRVRLQSATSSELPAYNPLHPPAVISQVMLLSNPQKGKVRLRYKLTFTHGDQKISELGEVDNFPDVGWSWTGF
ncbi:ADP-ribosylation factor-binding protein GGA1 [Amia ocellicauda]|uniref:ADP-ribosylation factor-binding protein GGA1 n=1 Tax=Amia ocellicauda TaxID=2972642 RepID=UPI0034648F9C